MMKNEKNEDDDYNNVNEEEAAMFLNNVRKTEYVVRAAQKERGAKAGELIVRAVMEHYWIKEGAGGRNVASPIPPKPDSRLKRDGTGNYNAGIPLQATIEEFPHYIPALCEKRTDGQAGWRIKWAVTYFEKAKSFLMIDDATPTPRALAAWKQHTIPEDDVLAYGLKEAAMMHKLTLDGYSNDPIDVRIRQCVTQQGKLLTEIWTNVAQGESVRFKGPDNSLKDNLLRLQNQAGAFVVQQSSPLIFNHVIPTIYVTFDDAGTDAAAAAATAVTAAGVPAPPPGPTSVTTGGNAATAAAAGAAKKREANLGMIFCYECKGSVLLRENKDAVDLCASERMHFARSKDAHQLVPIHLLRANTATVPKTCYFYVLPRYITRWSPEKPEWWPSGSQGISLFRNPSQLYDLKSTPAVQGGPVFYSLSVDLAVFQWRDRPNTNERYVVSARVRREDDVIWRSFGITHGEAYAAIMMANPDIPFHCTMNFWRKATMERPANDPREINRSEGTENIRGYYDFIIDSVTPDYRRHFPKNGIHLSQAYVEREFEDWCSENKKTKATTLRLNPYNETKRNPLHTLQGLSSAVLALGNGQPAPEGIPKLAADEGFYHACNGDITALLERNGRYQFYVLTSRFLNDEERAKYCGPNGIAADDWLTAQIHQAASAKTSFYYWIFALDTQAKIAKSHTETKTPAREEPSTSSSGTKRDRSEEEESAPAAADVGKKVARKEEEEEDEEEEDEYE
jgi:hypothetical protein